VIRVKLILFAAGRFRYLPVLRIEDVVPEDPDSLGKHVRNRFQKSKYFVIQIYNSKDGVMLQRKVPTTALVFPCKKNIT
jgi:hypothetical protein